MKRGQRVSPRLGIKKVGLFGLGVRFRFYADEIRPDDATFDSARRPGVIDAERPCHARRRGCWHFRQRGPEGSVPSRPNPNVDATAAAARGFQR